MKTILIFLIFLNAYSQDAVMNFYYGTKQSLGVELLIKANETLYLGGGFAGTLEKNKALGAFYSSDIKPNEIPISTTTQKWLALYGTASFGYLNKFQISYDLGASMNGRHANFIDQNGNVYHKKDKIVYKPMIGINAGYEITKDVGISIGYDTFSELKLGFTVYF